MTNTGSNQGASLFGGIKLNVGATAFTLNPNSSSFTPSGTTSFNPNPAQPV